MPSVDVNKCANVEVALRRLKRLCDRLGIPKRFRELESHMKRTTQRRRAKISAVKRRMKEDSKNQITSLYGAKAAKSTRRKRRR